MSSSILPKHELALVIAPLVALAAQWPFVLAFGLRLHETHLLAGATHTTFLLSLFGFPIAYLAEGAAILTHRRLAREHQHLRATSVLPIAGLIGALTYFLVWWILTPGSSSREFAGAGVVGASMGFFGGIAFLVLARPKTPD